MSRWSRLSRKTIAACLLAAPALPSAIHYSYSDNKQPPSTSSSSPSTSFFSSFFSSSSKASPSSPSPSSSSSTPSPSPSSDVKLNASWPIYRRKEVESHTTHEKGIWVIYNGGVYDITKFISNHPGGKDKILLAAGRDVEPFWRVYRQHYNSKLPLELMKDMQIGLLSSEDLLKEEVGREDDPYKADPPISPVLIAHSIKPVNAEPPASTLVDAYITPNELFFVRNHHPVPIVKEGEYRLPIYIDREGGKEKEKEKKAGNT